MGKHWPQMLTTLMLGVTSSSSSSWPESFTFLSTCNNATFSAFVVPLALQVKLSYTATHGAYYNSSDAANGTVDGWSRVHDLDANPVAGGMHAIVFVEAPSPASAPTSSTPVAIPRVVLSTPKVVAFFFFFLYLELLVCHVSRNGVFGNPASDVSTSLARPAASVMC